MRLRNVLVFLLVPALCIAGSLAPSISKALDESTYVYIASTRHDGTLGKPAEIWFLHHEGAVYVGTPPGSFRVRRIRAGRPSARIWVGRPNGLSFDAVGALVDDEAIREKLLTTFAKKYSEHWDRFAESFRRGFEDGSRVIVRYTPVEVTTRAPRASEAWPDHGSYTGGS